jgi:diguanylate cyclase (GGDEF)-like protein
MSNLSSKPTNRRSLGAKFSALIIIGVIVSVASLGVYFDTFLKENYLTSAQKRMEHGFKRLASDLAKNIDSLQKGISFIQDDEALLASIDLVNNYQDKVHYNAILLNEEKKIILQELLDRVKLSHNYEIALFDNHEELIAFVVDTEHGYLLNFIAYEEGRQLLYSRYESDESYSLNPDHTYLHQRFKHQSYYSKKTAGEGTVTYHVHDGMIITMSHMSIFQPGSDHVVAHIELAHRFDEAYYQQLSHDLDMVISGQTHTELMPTASRLSEPGQTQELTISESEQFYRSAAYLSTKDGEYYYVVQLDKTQLLEALSQNRYQLLIIMLVVALIVLIVLRLLFSRSLAGPLLQLMRQIDKIEQRDYSVSKVVQTGDELETISKSVNQLAMTVKEREAALQLSQKNLEYLSHHDSLTDLPNRRLLILRLEHAIEKAKRTHSNVAVLFLDLDEFKHVNDTLGHDVGDQLLVEVAKRLKHSIRESDTLARIGGDEFNILIEDIEHIRDIEVIAEKLLADFRLPFICNDQEISTTASIGIALYPEDGEEVYTLIKHSDLAMYQSKDEGRNSYSFFSKKLSDYMESRTTYINSMKATLKESCSEFYMVYQPKVSLETGEISGVEALVRWQSHDLGFVRPDKFITMAEETNMIIPLGEWILNRALKDFKAMQAQGCHFPKISVNVSGVQLLNSDMVRTVRRAIRTSGIRPEELELEITESYIATDQEKAMKTLKAFRMMDIDLSIDDFGTGYSSMSYLQQLPVTRLKIDKSFVDALPDSKESVAIATAIIALAKTFGLKITAEGVEREQQLAFFKASGADEVQGYYYAKPLTFEEFISFHKTFSAQA